MLARPHRSAPVVRAQHPRTSRTSSQVRSASWPSAALFMGILFSVTIALLPGCTRAFFRERADTDVERLLTEKSADDRWRLVNYYIYPHPYARFADLTGQPDKPPMPPDDPAAWVLSPKPQKPKAVFNSEGVGYLEMLAAFDAANRAARRDAAPTNGTAPTAPTPAPVAPPAGAEAQTAEAGDQKIVSLSVGGCPAVIAFGGNRYDRELPFLITVEQSLELAVINSRAFQNRREQLYLTALPVTLQRFGFMPQFQATADFFRRWSASESSFGKTDNLQVASGVGFSQMFETGALLVLQLANQTTIDFVNNGRPTLSQSSKFLELSQPFLQGGGRAVTLEPLTQTERNLLYDVRDFAHFHRTFFTAVSTGRVDEGAFGLGGFTGYLPCLLTASFLENARRNERDFLTLFQRYQAFVASGIQSQLQLDQIEQNYLNARLSVISTEVQLKNNLDSFKLLLGVPPDLPLELDETPLKPVKDQVDRFEKLVQDYRQILKDLDNLRDVPNLTQILRPELLHLFTEKPFTKGTQFALNLKRLWPEWERLTEAQLQERLRNLRLEREKIRLEDEKAKDLNQPLPVDRRNRLRLVEAGIQFGSLEETVRVYLQEPWKQFALPETQERSRREQFRAIVFRFTLLLETARTERLNDIQQSWPELPLVQLHGLNLMAMAEEESQNLVAQTALINRLDLMNQRAQVADAWRQIAVQANSLLGTFDVRYNLDVLTPPSQVAQPLNFDGNRARHQITLNTELPLVRRLERNNYRAALIGYQRSRRDLQQAEDFIIQQLRQTMRQLRQLRENMKIQQRALLLAYSQVDQALEAQFAPADPRRVSSDAGSAAALTDQVIRAQQGIPRAQNDLFRTWVEFLSARMELYRDLELMEINTQGVWINDFSQHAARNQPQP